MSRRDLVNRIAETTGHPKTHIDQVVVRFLEELGADLAEEGQVQLRGFGACWLHLPSALPGRDVGPIQLVATSRPSGVRTGS